MDQPAFKCPYATGYLYSDFAGERHNLNMFYAPSRQSQDCINAPPPSGDKLTGGDHVVLASGKAFNPTVNTADGTRYFFNVLEKLAGGHTEGLVRYVEDRNGNKVTLNQFTDPATNCYTAAATDTLGRTVFSTPEALDCGGGKITIAGFDNPFVLTFGANLSPNYSFQYTLVGPNNNGGCTYSPGGLPNSKLQTITLPNNKAYTISYDPSTGLISQLKYPSGATISYTWSTDPNSGFLSWPSSNGFVQSCQVRFGAPRLTKRLVSFDGVHVAQEQDYSYQTTWDPDPNKFFQWTTKQTTVVTKDCARAASCAQAPAFTTIYSYGPYSYGANNLICNGTCELSPN